MHLPEGLHVAVRGWLSANQIFLNADNTIDIVDSGFCAHANQTLQLVKHEFSKNPGSVPGKLLNTHLHSDHCGGNHALQASMGFEVWIPEASWEMVSAWDEEKLSYRQLGQPCPRFTPHQVLVPGTTLQLGHKEWNVLAAPGHDHHSIMLYQAEEGILISADALWENGFGAVFPELYDDGGFKEVKDTLDLISTLDISLVIPGHGEPFSDVLGALKRAYSRLDYLASSPEKNALHVAKVLFSYKLMELQKISRSEGLAWFIQTPIMAQIARELHISTEDLFEKTLHALVSANVLLVQGNLIMNHH